MPVDAGYSQWTGSATTRACRKQGDQCKLSTRPPPFCACAGLGAVNVCDLEGAVSRDSLPALLSGQTVTTLIIVTTKMLMETHSHVLKAILVSLWH